jgi:hypothetical protein
MGSKVQRFKGYIFITIHHFASILWGQNDRFHIPTNPEHGTWQGCGKTRIFLSISGIQFQFFPNLER